MKKRKTNLISPVFAFLLLGINLCCVDATIYLGNNETYDTLPGLFGRFMLDGKLYQARLQYLPENPYLCRPSDPEASSFVRPKGPEVPTPDGNVSIAEPVAILAARGNCPFVQKAQVAAAIDKTVEFLIVYNFNLDGSEEEEDMIVPMFSEHGDTRLVLLSVTHRTGVAIKKFLSEQPEYVYKAGGPSIHLDSTLPEGMLTVKDLQEALLSAIGLLFMLISFSGCMMILAGTYGQMHGGTRIVFNGVPVSSTGERLLTEEQVHQLSSSSQQQEQQPAVEDSEQQVSCAICIDDFAADSVITVLPCHHKFHTDCVVPWLTERQSKCPLCKFDVLQHVRDMEEDSGENGSQVSWWHRLRRYRWTRIHGHDAAPVDDRDGIVIAPDEMEINELELTEQQRIT